MKKLLFILITITGLLYADSAPEGDYHGYYRKVFITNPNAYPDTVLLGCIFDLSNSSMNYNAYSVYKIVSGEPLEQGYTFNIFRLLAIDKSLLTEFGDINATDYLNTEESELGKKLFDLSDSKDAPKIFEGHLYIEDDYPITEDSYYYEISSVNDDNLTLRLTRRVITFDDNTTKTIDY